MLYKNSASTAGKFFNPCYEMPLVFSLQGWKLGAYFGPWLEVCLFVRLLVGSNIQSEML